MKAWAIFCLSNLARVVLSAEFKNCGPQNTPIQVQNVSITPEKPLRGHPMQIIIKASMSGHVRQIENGTLKATVYYLGIPVYTHSADLCSSVPNGCPILPFDRVELNSTQPMPGWAPSGSYAIRFQGLAPQPCGDTQAEKGVEALGDEECTLLCTDTWFSMHSTKEQLEMEALIDEDDHDDDHIDLW